MQQKHRNDADVPTVETEDKNSFKTSGDFIEKLRNKNYQVTLSNINNKA